MIQLEEIWQNENECNKTLALIHRGWIRKGAGANTRIPLTPTSLVLAGRLDDIGHVRSGMHLHAWDVWWLTWSFINDGRPLVGGCASIQRLAN